jgi:YGGT family protein
MQPAHSVPPTQPVQPAVPVQPIQPGWSYRMDPGRERLPSVSPTYRASQILYLLLGIVETLIIIRVVLKLLAANSGVGFVRFAYGVSAPLMAPFQGIFPTPVSHNSVLELSSLVAIAVYALVAWGIVRIVFILGRHQVPTTAG